MKNFFKKNILLFCCYGCILCFNAFFASGQQRVITGTTPFRESDFGTPPLISLSSPPVSAGGSLTLKQSSVYIAGTVKDNVGIYSVSLNGKELLPDAKGAFQSTLPLNIGKNDLILSAADLSDNRTEFKFSLVRADDGMPEIVLTAPSGVLHQGRLEHEGAELRLRGTATDEGGLKEVLLNGKKMTLSAGKEFSAALPLQYGSNKITIVATDIYENSSELSFTVSRPDREAPEIVLQGSDLKEGEVYRTIGTAYRLLAKVKDNDGISRLLLNGSPRTLSNDGTLDDEIPLSLGINPIEIEVYDKDNNKSSKQWQIERLADNPPVVMLLQPNVAKGDSWGTAAGELLLSGIATDEIRVTKLTINGTVQNLSEGGAFSSKIKLAYGDNTVRIEAIDGSNKYSDYYFTVNRRTSTSNTTEVVENPEDPRTDNSALLLFWLQPNTDFLQGTYNSESSELPIQLKAVSRLPLTESNFTLYINEVAQSVGKARTVNLKETPTTAGNSNEYTYTYQSTVALQEGINNIRVEIKNALGSKRSSPLPVSYTAQKPNLYVLSVGVKQYDLNYTVQDGKDVAAFFQKNKTALEQWYGNIEVNELTGSEATSTNIRVETERYLSRYKTGSISPRDVLLVFISSHGFVEDEVFYIQGADYDNGARTSTSVDYGSLSQRVLEKLPCKKLVFIDACHSGDAKTPLAADINEALRRLSNTQSGITTLTSSSGSELSYEDATWQNGAFTEALLQGLDCRADQNSNGIITLQELYNYVRREVPEMVQKKKSQQQTPQLPRNDLGDLPLMICR